ncbi:MAG: pyridoxamine 5'-phosphate oxidase family protein [bacterium]
MEADLKKTIKQAQELLLTSRHASMATVNEDGSPHSTPFRLLYDPKLEFIYWGSHPDSLHSKNIMRTGKIFVVLYDKKEKISGLYIKCENAHMVEGEELQKALEVHNSFRIKENSAPLTIDYYMGNNPQRMWSTEIKNLWVNGIERDANGKIARDGRIEISAKDLIL